MTPYEHFAESIQHFAEQDLEAALASARQARDAKPGELLYADAARYLEKVQEASQRQALYTAPDAFSAFISGGSNLPLYDRTRELLAARLRALQPATLLDIGTGEGSIIVPVASQLPASPALTFCEPSLTLLNRAIELAHNRGLEPEAFPYRIEDVLPNTEDEWEVAIATWSLHNLKPQTRADVLAQLAGRVEWLFLAEFDDLSGAWEDPLAPGRIRHIHDRYRVGVREYAGARGRRVRHGFLMPVLYGYFAPHERRSTYEQPIAQWEEELRQGGFTTVRRTLIHPYWWADAYLLEATASSSTPVP